MWILVKEQKGKDWHKGKSQKKVREPDKLPRETLDDMSGKPVNSEIQRKDRE